jgi:hypothetical protein
MSDGAIFLLAIFLIFLRFLYMLATRKKIEVEPYYPAKDEYPTDPHRLVNHGLSPGDVGYQHFRPDDKS